MNNTVENYENIQELADMDVHVLEAKGKSYGRSWMKRGGIGAMMMLARKWDRIENIVQTHGWDIFEAGLENTGDINDDIADLRRYLFLVESEIDMQRMYRDEQAEIKLDEPLVSVQELETGVKLEAVVGEELGGPDMGQAAGVSYVDPDRGGVQSAGTG